MPLSEILQLSITQIVLLEDIVNNYNENGFDKIFFILPTTHSIDRVIRCISQSPYQNHLYLLDSLSKSLEFKIINSGVIPKLVTLKEIPLNYTIVESRAFSTNQPSAFHSYYSQPTNYPSSELQVALTVKSLENILLALNIHPIILYQNSINGVGTYATPVTSTGNYLNSNPSPPIPKKSSWKSSFSSSQKGSGVARRVAVALSKQLTQIKRDNHDFGLANSATNPTLLITDRTLDLALPLLHNFSYQSLTNDLLTQRSLDSCSIPPIFSYKSSQSQGLTKQHPLSDYSDSIWCDIRHLHLKDAIDKVGELARQAERADQDLKNASGLDGLRGMLAGLTDHADIKDKAYIHTTLSDQLMGEVNNRNLMQVSDVEQCCATGLTADNRTPRHLIEQMVPLLDHPTLLNRDKIRIIALYILFKDGVSDEDKRRLYQHARLAPNDHKAIDNLVYIGVRVNKNDSEQQAFRRYKYKGKSDDDAYDTSRYIPALKTTLTDLIHGKLDTGVFSRLDGVEEGGGADASGDSLKPTSGNGSGSSNLSLRSSNSHSRPRNAPHSQSHPATCSSSPSSLSTTPAPSQGSLRSARATWASASRSASYVSGGGGSGSVEGNTNANASVNGNGGSTRGLTPTQNTQQTRNKILVYVCGGMTYSEVQSVYEVCETHQRDVLIGSTDILTPTRFLDNVRNLDTGYVYGEGASSLATANDAQKTFAGTSTALNKPDRYMHDPHSQLSDKNRQETPDLSPEQAQHRYLANLQQGYDRKYWSDEVKPALPPTPVDDINKDKARQPEKKDKDKKAEKKDDKKLRKEQKEIDKVMAKQHEAERKKEKKWGMKGWF
ncbi:hypothetical protein E3P89_03460 [Wallemia ichthyophaga]|uniref:Protein transport protein sec1 n=1 Tax=Wallemia ichthyophaga TaxID=245174 RepID=A0A4V4LY81_WALIC|nr:hypothetical protein E3P93_03476 [Wallemia ichthyophaga]TIB08994.1 hypothetical protein E3P90_03453 [Wallemia ichthyophaga]TIB20030.1 hypothetical protein E3P89_03460 [Wallemia ichthyophaga]TIB21497.1 hypothetical protein E3P88_03468 [Wallemia ichthyophaga]